MSKPLKLYELAAADASLRFSPYCWRTRLALAHKGLTAQSIAWRFTDKDEIAFSGQGKVPVLVDGSKVVHDSQEIAVYLEANYPNGPSLFGDSQSAALMQFVRQWADNVLHPAIARIVLPDIFGKLAPKDQAYFRASREAFFGKTIETMAAEREGHIPAFQAALVPVSKTLQVQPFISGNGPAYADHIVFGALQWARLMSSTVLWEPDDVITHWMDALLVSYGLT